MLIKDDELMDELTCFLVEGEETYVEDAKTDYFVFGTGQASFTDWVARLVNVALHDDKFKSALPGWQDVDFTDGSYDSILLRSLLNDPSCREVLRQEFESLEDTLG